MLYIIEVDIANDNKAPQTNIDGVIRERLRGVTTVVPGGGVATVTHCKRLTSELLDQAFGGNVEQGHV